MKTSLRLICGVLAGAFALALTACSSLDVSQSTAVATTSPVRASDRAPETYRQVGSNIPVATPARPMSDTERQEYGDYLGRYPGMWGPRG